MTEENKNLAELAKEYDGEIISADSMQIYKGMDIGTAKVKSCEKEGITHHLIDVVDPDEDFTVSDFQNQAMFWIEELNKRSKMPIIVGGTGLYIHSLTYQLDFQKTKSDSSIRDKWRKKIEQNRKNFNHYHPRDINGFSINNSFKRCSRSS